ncbi:hypothetical protein JAAARDRAFT_525851 [Jaapia argillacea MUCL 33604]|uniref:NAD(P)-binding domain-containing protein n=1 Tax=Jaapia argillacea MUCL 33604 TaxID=933084 RepID=A0A067QH42_9AGAM|nr:hypothetical protein JAAARDRAFT_525851 [Jaapia argillacea MUCL 33604]
MSAIIFGATGATGKHVLKEVLASSHFTRVGEYGRRVTDSAQLSGGKEKLEQKVIDFEKLGDAGIKEGKWDVVFITLGTTRAAAGSAAAFEKIDREFVINAAKAAKSDDPEHKQRIIYLSSGGANASSSFLYMRSKGLTEQGLAALGFDDTIVFRPGYLKDAERPTSRPIEGVLNAVTGVFGKLFTGLAIPVSTLATSIRRAGELGSSGLPPAANATTAGLEGSRFTLIGNDGALGLAKTPEST